MDSFFALAEPKRRTIIELLAIQGQLSSSAISRSFNISSAAVSQHLKVLRETKLVLMEKKAQQRIYRLNPKALEEIERWANHTTQLWNDRFNALDNVLEEQINKSKGEPHD